MEKKPSDSGQGGASGFLFFLAGFIIALIFGWGIFPKILFSVSYQPIKFSHAIEDHAGLDCEECHFFREDGSYAGIPKLEKCMECHEEIQGENPEEKKFVENYVQKDKEVPWLKYQWQPDNVYFSHAAHLKREKPFECTTCHRDVTKEKIPPPVKINRLTGYHFSTIKMHVCEDCHAKMGANNACNVCHK